MSACASAGKNPASSDSVAEESDAPNLTFSGDSAYMYVEKQVNFGPRVPNTPAHQEAGDWLVAELKRHGASVVEQPLSLRAFDGTMLKARNILGQYNPEAADRILLLAHWDCRPWADEDPDPEMQKLPVDGANDGASGVGVLLEIARQLNITAPSKGVDILFVDAEDWGSSNDDDSWALGAAAFVNQPPIKGYAPREAILLDMVGGTNAQFYREYFSEQSASSLNNKLWQTASSLGYSSSFPNKIGGAINDDHLKFIEAGIPAVDIIEFDPSGKGFNPRWHTSQDKMDGISKSTLEMVGNVVLEYIRKNN